MDSSSSRHEHAVRVYSDDAELVAHVAAHLAEAFDAGEPAVVIATEEHWRATRAELAARDWDAERIDRDAVLFHADADETLAALLVDGVPSAERFDAVIGGVLDAVAARARGARVRAFGEMVDILHARGDLAEAIALEELWEEALARRGDFTLLCAYKLDLFDRRVQAGVMPEVCRTHSHVVPAADADRLERAVAFALERELGTAVSERIYAVADEQPRREQVPTPQVALMWVSRHMPTVAERVLTTARRYYRPVTAS